MGRKFCLILIVFTILTKMKFSTLNEKVVSEMNLCWVTLKVSNLEKSLFFYTKLLNLGISEEFDGPEHQIVMVGKANETKIELICEPHTKINNPGNGVSIGMEADDLDGLIGILKENGYKTVGPVSPNSHIKFFFVQDPDGYTVQLVKHK